MLRLTIPGKTTDIGDQQQRRFFIDMLKYALKRELELQQVLAIAFSEGKHQTLKNVLAGYLTQVHRQAIRIEEIFGILLMQPGGDNMSHLKNLSREINGLNLLVHQPQSERTILGSIYRVNQHKLVLYSNLLQLAESLGMDDVNFLLSQSMQEEKQTTEYLTAIRRRQKGLMAEA